MIAVPARVELKKYALFALLVIFGSARFVAQVFDWPAVDEVFEKFLLSPHPQPFVNLPGNPAAHPPQEVEVCSIEGCTTGTFREQISSLKGPHRYEVPFYLIAHSDITQHFYGTILKNILCRPNVFLNRPSASAPLTVRYGDNHYDCKK